MNLKNKWQPNFALFDGLGVDGKPFIADIFPTEDQVRMCLDSCSEDDPRIHSILVREERSGDKPTHWGWREKDGNLCMIQPSRFQFEVCFPYGVEAEEKAGHGKAVCVVILEVDLKPGVGDEVISRSNENDPLMFGKIIRYEPVSRAQVLMPVVLFEDGRELFCPTILVKRDERLIEALVDLNPNEQYALLAWLKIGHEWGK